MLEAGRERLHPSQAIGPRQHGGRDLADERVGAGHRRFGLGGGRGVDPLGLRRGRLQRRERSGSTAGWITSFIGDAPVSPGIDTAERMKDDTVIDSAYSTRWHVRTSSG